MKKILSTLLISFGLMMTAQAQEASISNDFGIGFQLSQYQRDFGFGINATSPYFANNALAIRLKANVMFNEHLQDGEITWTPYTNLSLGLVSGSAKVGKHIRLYGEGGVIGLLPASDFSSEDFEVGGYGLFGFEFYMVRWANYFIEIGGVGTGARADQVPTQPIYSNGLVISTGFRAHL